MAMTPIPKVTLTPVAYFPQKYFLENLAVRVDGSVLITAVLQKELWCVPATEAAEEASPVLVHTFEQLITGIVEIEHDYTSIAQLVGPSSAVWGRNPGDPGRVAYVTTDGGTTAPPDGVIRRASLLRLELHSAAGSAGGA